MKNDLFGVTVLSQQETSECLSREQIIRSSVAKARSHPKLTCDDEVSLVPLIDCRLKQILRIHSRLG